MDDTTTNVVLTTLLYMVGISIPWIVFGFCFLCRGNSTIKKICKNVLFGGLTLTAVLMIVGAPMLIQYWYWEFGQNMEWLAISQHPDHGGNLYMVLLGVVSEASLLVVIYNCSFKWYETNYPPQPPK